MELRPALPDDIPGLARLWHSGWHEAHAELVPAALTAHRTEASFAIRLTRHLATVTVATTPGIAGFVKTAEGELDQLFVADTARGTGVAAALLAEAEQQLRAAGTQRAHLFCAIGNMRAARFYEKSGWVRMATVTETVEMVEGRFPLTVWRYEKDLHPGG